MALASRNLLLSVAFQVEQLIQRLPEFCDADITPALLHGDAQQNNFISTAQGTVVIDLQEGEMMMDVNIRSIHRSDISDIIE